MKLPAWFPHPIAWLSALLLRAFIFGFSMALAIVLPILFELAKDSPRLAWLGILGLWLSPIALIAIAHHLLHATIDLGDRTKFTRGVLPSAQSWFAGMFAWAGSLLVSVTTSLVLLVIDPPPIEPDAFLARTMTMNATANVGVGTIVWLVLAASMFHLERAIRKADTAT